jgi:uncharacterized membrane protein
MQQARLVCKCVVGEINHTQSHTHTHTHIHTHTYTHTIVGSHLHSKAMLFPKLSSDELLMGFWQKLQN